MLSYQVDIYVDIIIYSNKLLLFVGSTLNKEKKEKKGGCEVEHHETVTR